MTRNELELRISLVLPDAARPTLTAYRDEHPDLDATTLDLVNELLTHGRTTIHPRPSTTTT